MVAKKSTRSDRLCRERVDFWRGMGTMGEQFPLDSPKNLRKILITNGDRYGRFEAKKRGNYRVIEIDRIVLRSIWCLFYSTYVYIRGKTQEKLLFSLIRKFRPNRPIDGHAMYRLPFPSISLQRDFWAAMYPEISIETKENRATVRSRYFDLTANSQCIEFAW